MEDIILRLFDLGGIQFGTFRTKSGLVHPIYIDLRTAMADPDLSRQIARQFYMHIWNKLEKADKPFPDLVCGVPLGSLHFASILSADYGIPAIIPRKAAKEYGKGNRIEGKYEPGQRVLVIEDIITTGGSVLETRDILHEAGLTTGIVCFLAYYPKLGDLRDVQALTTVQHIMKVLWNNGRVSKSVFFQTLRFFEHVCPYTGICAPKEANASRVVVALDVENARALELMDLLGPHVYGFKFHFDWDDYDLEAISDLADKHDVRVIDDRKYGDVYKTNARVFEWTSCADILICHALPGAASFPSVGKDTGDILLVMDMSTDDGYFPMDYMEYCLELGRQHPNVVGFISQYKWWPDADLCCMTPGISGTAGTSENGQVYQTIEDKQAQGADFFIIGSAITTADDPLEALQTFNGAVAKNDS